MFVPIWMEPKICAGNCQNGDENPDLMVKHSPTPTQAQCFYV